MPRPSIIILLGLAVAVVVFMYARGSGGDDFTVDEPASNGGTNASKPQQDSSPPVSQGKASTKTGSAPASDGSKSSTDTPSAPGANDATKSGANVAPGSSTPYSIPRPVAAALVDGKVVVLFFGNTKNPEDSAVSRAVAGLRGSVSKSKLAVFTDSYQRIAKYSLYSGDVRRAPAVVVIGRGLQSEVVEGLIDTGRLREMVLQASRVKPA